MSRQPLLPWWSGFEDSEGQSQGPRRVGLTLVLGCRGLSGPVRRASRGGGRGGSVLHCPCWRADAAHVCYIVLEQLTAPPGPGPLSILAYHLPGFLTQPHPVLSDWITNEGAPPTVGFAVLTLPFLKGRDSGGKGTRTGCVHLRPGCPSRGPRVDGPESLLPNATDVMAPSCSGCVLSHKVEVKHMSLTSSAHPAPSTYMYKRRDLRTSQSRSAAAKVPPTPPRSELPGFESSLRQLPSDSEPQLLACMAFL